MGQDRRIDDVRDVSGVPLIASELAGCSNEVRASRDLVQCSKRSPYSITSSATVRMSGVTVSPIALAVLR